MVRSVFWPFFAFFHTYVIDFFVVKIFRVMVRKRDFGRNFDDFAVLLAGTDERWPIPVVFVQILWILSDFHLIAS